MDETLAELTITNTATEKRSSWHYVYAEPHPPASQGRWAVIVARHRRGGQQTTLAVYPDQAHAEIIADMLSGGGHYYQTGGTFHKHPIYGN
jgi:hypothetical protein